ncbi:CpXC domain-containing protein [Psychroserpens luteolus]|uniref:CpXC domain-containing protein n=1 Tax=Psychroserpens luteolus TaxID=2855840 RepID=UPI001E4D7A3A|nr:CpXC domain-containing protein [Psychroserpens luteolus]MCD2258801.1 CpXC domain-containing protein [Psychroserpens luteolus]
MPIIPCPNCQSNIEFELHDVLKEKEFTCPNCKTVITMVYEDNKQSLDKAKKALDKLKDELDID